METNHFGHFRQTHEVRSKWRNCAQLKSRAEPSFACFQVSMNPCLFNTCALASYLTTIFFVAATYFAPHSNQAETADLFQHQGGRLGESRSAPFLGDPCGVCVSVSGSLRLDPPKMGGEHHRQPVSMQKGGLYVCCSPYVFCLCCFWSPLNTNKTWHEKMTNPYQSGEAKISIIRSIKLRACACANKIHHMGVGEK